MRTPPADEVAGGQGASGTHECPCKNRTCARGLGSACSPAQRSATSASTAPSRSPRALGRGVRKVINLQPRGEARVTYPAVRGEGPCHAARSSRVSDSCQITPTNTDQRCSTQRSGWLVLCGLPIPDPRRRRPNRLLRSSWRRGPVAGPPRRERLPRPIARTRARARTEAGSRVPLPPRCGGRGGAWSWALRHETA